MKEAFSGAAGLLSLIYDLWQQAYLIETEPFIIIIIYFPSIDSCRITKSKWIWKSSHFRENKE
jgi:hypothetical protein